LPLFSQHNLARFSQPRHKGLSDGDSPKCFTEIWFEMSSQPVFCWLSVKGGFLVVTPGLHHLVWGFPKAKAADKSGDRMLREISNAEQVLLFCQQLFRSIRDKKCFMEVAKEKPVKQLYEKVQARLSPKLVQVYSSDFQPTASGVKKVLSWHGGAGEFAGHGGQDESPR